LTDILQGLRKTVRAEGRSRKRRAGLGQVAASAGVSKSGAKESDKKVEFSSGGPRGPGDRPLAERLCQGLLNMASGTRGTGRDSRQRRRSEVSCLSAGRDGLPGSGGSGSYSGQLGGREVFLAAEEGGSLVSRWAASSSGQRRRRADLWSAGGPGGLPDTGGGGRYSGQLVGLAGSRASAEEGGALGRWRVGRSPGPRLGREALRVGWMAWRSSGRRRRREEL
jgi:hypothetical protein